ncbi:MAG: rRNA maturation RNase YbeY [Firmicutes bacterium]|nr:rRNA maturation RNase YbeY [Bacillota bacterium]MBR6236140.1 rRNA maturation RNase YbeY [Bacillota bacterium]
MTLYFDEDVRPDDATAAEMEAAAVAALEGEGIDPDTASISVSFVDKAEIKRLNKEYRGVDKVTDVLSFPLYESGCIPAPEDLTEDEELALGDVVICEEVCEAQAKEYGHSIEREIIYLFTHSVFHLLGYDHETEEDKADMRAREEEVMSLLGLER